MTPAIRCTAAPVSVEQLALDFLARGLSVEFEVTGGSMAPFIRDNDVVTVMPVDGEGVGVGDVVVWSRGNNRLVVHRVVASRGIGITTRGDAMRLPDERLSSERLVGKVTGIHRDGLPLKWGLGSERLVLGWLSRLGLLRIILRAASKLGARRSAEQLIDQVGCGGIRPAVDLKGGNGLNEVVAKSEGFFKGRAVEPED